MREPCVAAKGCWFKWSETNGTETAVSDLEMTNTGWNLFLTKASPQVNNTAWVH